MADRRMFAQSIVLSDSFLDMPMSARCLYFTLGMLADDEGFVGAPKRVMRDCGASMDDMNILLAKRYLLGFESGVIVIKHWKLNNLLRSDRLKETTYIEEKAHLMLDEKGAYTEFDNQLTTNCQPSDNQVTTKCPPSIGKDSIGKNSKVFVPPTLEEIEAYCKERGKGVDAEQVFTYYSERNWVDTLGHPVQNWKSKIVAVWENKVKKPASSKTICNDASEMSKYKAKNGGIDFDVL